ncbi:ABC transporter substrate-binding protein [Nocardia sp. NPDC052278]|uniref:ABC transporter substrate-binding protein n=1 Tax=unclassified Nocardia TaxID=2637762 RepID=UPI003695FC8B
MKVPWNKSSAVAVVCVTTLFAAAACAGSTGHGDHALNRDADIVIGGTFPMSGPLASYAALAGGFDAYLQYRNESGGVKGHKLVLKTMDDAYDPARAASNVRSLVQRDNVFTVVTFGGAPVVAREFLEQSRTPQFGFAGLSALSAIDKYRYTRSWWPDLASIFRRAFGPA